jgi:hypothetical protein
MKAKKISINVRIAEQNNGLFGFELYDNNNYSNGAAKKKDMYVGEILNALKTVLEKGKQDARARL